MTAEQIWHQLIGSPSGYFLLVSSIVLLVGLLTDVRIGVIRWIRNTRGMTGTSPESRSMSRTSNSNWTTRRRGLAHPSAILITVLSFAVVIIVPTSIALARYFSRYPIYTLEGVQVVSQEQSPLPGYSYWMIYNSESVGPLKFIARFCPDYKPPFDPGDYLTLLRYEDHRDCWSLKDDHAGVMIRRDEHGRTDSEINNEQTR